MEYAYKLSWWKSGAREAPSRGSHLVTIHTCELSVSEAGMGTSPTISARGFIRLYTRTSTYNDAQCLSKCFNCGPAQGKGWEASPGQSGSPRGSHSQSQNQAPVGFAVGKRQLVATSTFRNTEWNGFSLLKHLRTLKNLTCTSDVSQMYDSFFSKVQLASCWTNGLGSCAIRDSFILGGFCFLNQWLETENAFSLKKQC